MSFYIRSRKIFFFKIFFNFRKKIKHLFISCYYKSFSYREFYELPKSIPTFLKTRSVQKLSRKMTSLLKNFFQKMIKLCDIECNVFRRKVFVIYIFFYGLKSETHYYSHLREFTTFGIIFMAQSFSNQANFLTIP